MTQCPIWNRGALKVDPPCLCVFGADNNCGLFFDHETGECRLITMTLRQKMKKQEVEEC